jgi:hypothetical protein
MVRSLAGLLTASVATCSLFSEQVCARSRGMSRIQWQQDKVAGVPLNRHLGFVGPVEVGHVAYDGSNRFWIWSTPLQEDAWGYGPTEQAAKAALEHWLVAWLENFRPFFQADA